LVEGFNQFAPVFGDRASNLGALLLHQPPGSMLIPAQVYAQ
jgi:hypothetical protein